MITGGLYGLVCIVLNLYGDGLHKSCMKSAHGLMGPNKNRESGTVMQVNYDLRVSSSLVRVKHY